MAKPHPLITITPGLTFDGTALRYGDRSSPVLACVRAVFDKSTPGSDLERDLGQALGLHAPEGASRWTTSAVLARTGGGLGAAGWAALLGLDPTLCALVQTEGPASVGAAVLDAVARAGSPPATPVALVLAVAEAAVRDAQRSHGAKPPKRATPAEVRAWERADEQMRRHIYTEAARHPTTPEALPAVRLWGGLCGARGVVLRPAGSSAIAWATAAWRVVRAPLLTPRPITVDKPAADKSPRELPVVVSVDGVVVVASHIDAASAVAAAQRHETGARLGPVLDGDAFMVRASQARDERTRLPGEVGVLENIARGEWTGGSTEERGHARRLAEEFTAKGAEPGAPRFVAVRDAVRDLIADKRRGSRYLSVADEVNAWAGALALLGAREEAAALDASEGAWLDDFEATPRGVLGTLLHSTAAAPFDGWTAHVAAAALALQVEHLGVFLTRPESLRRLTVMQRRATTRLPLTSRARVAALVAVELDRSADLMVIPCDRWATAIRTATGIECAIAVQQGLEWRVLVGSLPALVGAGLLEDMVVRDGIVTATWRPYAGDASDIAERAVQHAVEAWEAADWVGAPPSLADSITAVQAANDHQTARPRKKRAA